MKEENYQYLCVVSLIFLLLSLLFILNSEAKKHSGAKRMGVTISSLANGKTMYVWNATVPSVQSMAGTLTNNSSIQTIEIDNTGNNNGLTITDNSSGWSMPIQPGQRLICNCPPSNNPVYSLSGNSANVTIYLYDFIFSQPGIISTSTNDVSVSNSQQLPAIARGSIQLAGSISSNTRIVYLTHFGTTNVDEQFPNPPIGTNWYCTEIILTTQALQDTTAHQCQINALANGVILFADYILVPDDTHVSWLPVVPLGTFTFIPPIFISNSSFYFSLQTPQSGFGGGTYGSSITAQAFFTAF